jgi:hypothetical protein
VADVPSRITLEGKVVLHKVHSTGAVTCKIINPDLVWYMNVFPTRDSAEAWAAMHRMGFEITPEAQAYMNQLADLAEANRRE